jgi:hypothetical protein
MSEEEERGGELILPGPPPFECIRDPSARNCFKIAGKFTVCGRSPCPLNQFEFHKHERIIRTYLREQAWEDAYDYFHAVLVCFDVCKWGTRAEAKKEPTPLQQGKPTDDAHESACRVFTEKKELAQDLELLIKYQLMSESEFGKRAQQEYHDTQKRFRRILFSALKDIELVALKNRAVREQHEYLYSKRLQLIDKINENPNAQINFDASGDIDEALRDPEHLDLQTGVLRDTYERRKEKEERARIKAAERKRKLQKKRERGEA